MVYEQKIVVPRFEESKGFYTTKERSSQMAKIKAKNTKPEMLLRKKLHSEGIRFRLYNKKLSGTPDISISKYRLAIFVDGEFWHGRNWDQKKENIKSNRDFWIPKIERNIQRDSECNQLLESQGYKVFRFWESDVKYDLEGCVSFIRAWISEFKSMSSE